MDERQEVVERLWRYCHVLRHDGLDYTDYIEELSQLLFLKVAHERSARLPAVASWERLSAGPADTRLKRYRTALAELASQRGPLGDALSGASTQITDLHTFEQLFAAIDALAWAHLGADLPAAVFEGLLEKSAGEGKRGAGQYFTPRALVESIVRVVQPAPDSRNPSRFSVCDPAAGTGGFLVAAWEWLRRRRPKLATLPGVDRAYQGIELVPRPHRLACMNLWLHHLAPRVELRDAIYGPPDPHRYRFVLTNPPFGNRGARRIPDRPDLPVATADKQLNFLQLADGLLADGGRAAVVLPDSALFSDRAAPVLRRLMNHSNLHTLLRLPSGVFAPYSAGVKTCVAFFTKGAATERTWLYDMRAARPAVSRALPLTRADLLTFEAFYGSDPGGLAPRERTYDFTRLLSPAELVQGRALAEDVPETASSAKDTHASIRDGLEHAARELAGVLTAVDELACTLQVLERPISETP